MTQEHPEGWQPKLSPEEVSDEVDRVLGLIERKAANEHGGDYAAGMRNARRIVETELDY